MTHLSVYVPMAAAPDLAPIEPRSAIVGAAYGENVLICHEGDFHRAVTVRGFGDKLSRAANRLMSNYPTDFPPADSLRQVGSYLVDEDVRGTGVLTVTDQPALDDWLRGSGS